MNNSELKMIDAELEKLLLKSDSELGHSRVVKKMMFILLISDKEISMEELAKRTNYSLATLSNTIKSVEKLGLVERVPYPRTKRVYVKAKSGFYDLIKNTVKTQYDKFLPRMSKLNEIESKYKKIKKNNLKKRLDFINDIRRFRNAVEKINKILEEE